MGACHVAAVLSDMLAGCCGPLLSSALPWRGCGRVSRGRDKAGERREDTSAEAGPAERSAEAGPGREEWRSEHIAWLDFIGIQQKS